MTATTRAAAAAGVLTLVALSGCTENPSSAGTTGSIAVTLEPGGTDVVELIRRLRIVF